MFQLHPDSINTQNMGLPLKLSITSSKCKSPQHICLCMPKGQIFHSCFAGAPTIFHSRFKVLVPTLKTLCGLGLDYLKIHFLHHEPVLWLKSSAEALLWVPSPAEVWSVSTREQVISAMAAPVDFPTLRGPHLLLQIGKDGVFQDGISPPPLPSFIICYP